MKNNGLFSYLLSNAVVRLLVAALAADLAQLAVCVSLARLGYGSVCDNLFVFCVLFFAFTFVFYKGITAYNLKPEDELK